MRGGDRRLLGDLLGRLSDGITQPVDRWMGSDWADNDEILALTALAAPTPPSTSELAEVSGLGRRAVSRLVARLTNDGYVTTERSSTDGRRVLVALTKVGRDRMTGLARELDVFFSEFEPDAARMLERMGCAHTVRASEAVPMASLDVLAAVARAGRELVRAIDSASGAATISGRQRSALVQIAVAGTVRPIELSPSLRISRAGVSYVIDQLCAKGLVRRLTDAPESDRRAVLLEATSAGHRAAAAVYDAIELTRPPLCEMLTAIVARTGDVDEIRDIS